MLLTALTCTKLSIDPAVPLFGVKPYPYGMGAISKTKYQLIQQGKGGQDAGCPDCFKNPPHTSKRVTGSWYFYNDPTWDFSADEPRENIDCNLGEIMCRAHRLGITGK